MTCHTSLAVGLDYNYQQDFTLKTSYNSKKGIQSNLAQISIKEAAELKLELSIEVQ